MYNIPEKMSDPPDYEEATSTPKEPARLAMLSIIWTDSIGLLRFPEEITALTSEVLSKIWPKGVQKVRPCDEAVEIKLRGIPFAHGGDDQKIGIRLALMGILDAKEGWIVRPAGRVGRMGMYAHFGQKDSLIFQHQSPRTLSWLCVSFDSTDLLHLVNAPTELATSIIDVFGSRVEKCNKDFVSGIFELKFKGTPWAQPTSEGAVRSRLIVLDLMQCLEDRGYTMCTALDLDQGVGGCLYSSYGEMWLLYR